MHWKTHSKPPFKALLRTLLSRTLPRIFSEPFRVERCHTILLACARWLLICDPTSHLQECHEGSLAPKRGPKSALRSACGHLVRSTLYQVFGALRATKALLGAPWEHFSAQSPWGGHSCTWPGGIAILDVPCSRWSSGLGRSACSHETSSKANPDNPFHPLN